VILVSPESVREAEARSRGLLQISEDLQMERASLGAWKIFRQTFPDADTIAVLCGPGANGGDGLALARHALLDGFRPIVSFPGPHPAEGSLAFLQYRRLQALGLECVPWQGLAELEPAVPAVDALFGTGLSRGLSDEFHDAAGWLSARRTLALDLPSGLDGRTGHPLGEAVRATATVSFGRAKTGLFLDPGREFAGAVHVVDIGIPDSCWDSHGVQALDSDWACDRLPPRPRGAHKGSAGKAVLLVGSREYFGAAVLSSSAALRSGAGMVTVASVPEVAEIIARTVPECLGKVAFGPSAIGVDQILSKADAVLAGPGIGQGEDAESALASLLEAWTGPVVLDADALNLVAARPHLRGLLDDHRGRLVLTPHPLEASRLLGVPVQELLADPVHAARRLALAFDAVVVFKTATPVVASPDGRSALGIAGHSGMAVGGCGDALAGAVVARLAEGQEPFEATCQAVRAHARAGDIAGDGGKRGMSVTDLVAALPRAWQEMEKS
jgi:NAD(P)H-hydrate epimerase